MIHNVNGAAITHKNKLPLRTLCRAILLVLIFAPLMNAQIVRILPLDVKRGLEKGTIRLTISPPFVGDTAKAFDGNPLTAIEMHKTDSLVITMWSDSAIVFEKCNVFFWTRGQWRLEVAESLSDLLQRKGTYTVLVSNRPNSGFVWDSLAFPQVSVRAIRFEARNPLDSLIMLGELWLQGKVTFTHLLVLPSPIKLLPNTHLSLSFKIVDQAGKIYQNFLTEPMVWTTSDPGIATIDENGRIRGVVMGSTSVNVRTATSSISGTAPAHVLNDFRPQKIAPMNVKVALLLFDPIVLTAQGYRKIHEVFGWRDPVELSHRLVKHFREASDGVLNFQIIQTINGSKFFTVYRGGYLTPNQYYELLKEPGWTSLRSAEKDGLLTFDYREMIKFYGYDTQRNNGEIDEVWVFAGPFMGMYESQLMGPKAFWWNSLPITSGTTLTKLLSVMGLNYERGVDQAFHSFGHRSESALRAAFQDAQGKPWNPNSSDPTAWDLFTRYDKIVGFGAHVGNIHFPPNGERDYDYGNTTLVNSYAENWYRYPYLFDQTSMVNVWTWWFRNEEFPNGDPLAEGQDHLGYLRWWYGHLPRYEGVTEGVLNNWWHYIVDYEGAVALAKQTPIVGVTEKWHPPQAPRDFELEQNYPNPFNPSTVIRYTLAHDARTTLTISDLLGREIATLVDEWQTEGPHTALWEARNMPSGVYFYQLKIDSRLKTRKMILIR